MDEPTVGLDPLLQSEIYKVLIEMRDKGSSIFISSHNLPEVQKICDRAAIIKNGKIVAIESIKTLNQKRLHKIQVIFADKYSISEFKVQGVNKIETIEGGFIIHTVGDINAILRVIVKHQLIDLEVEHASLEDIFMKFYERKK
jgi:ABC-2 type transport system ATP-binding protein